MTRTRTTAILSAAVAIAWVVGRDGTTHWRLFRLAVGAGATFGLLRLDRSTRPRGAALAVAGLIATGVGVGIGPAWLTKDGLGPMAIAGVIALVAGVALLGFAVTDLVRRPWARVLTALGLLVVLAIDGLTLGVAVAATNVPPTAIGATPADRGITAGDLELVTEDGVTLAAWYAPSRNGAAVVLLHGAGSTRSSVLDEMAVLVEHGYGVLAYDARGHGDSGGRAMDFGWFGNWDTFAAVDWLLTSPDVDPGRIGLVGLSMGGEVAIGTAAFHGKVRAVVAEGATGRIAADKAWLPEEYGFAGSVQRILDRLTFGFADLFTETSPPVSLRRAAAATAPRPILLITAGEVPDEAHAAAYIAAGSPGTVAVVDFPGSPHTGALATDPGRWEQVVIGFLDAALAE